MVPLVEIPAIVQHDAPCFASVFSPQAFEQFQRDISGLIVSEHKTVDGINRLFVLDVRNPSRLHRLFTERPFSVGALHRCRVAFWQSQAGPTMKPKGVLSLDETLRTHDGQHFEKIAYLSDSAQQCYGWAHHLVKLHDRDDQPASPIDFRLWEPADPATLETGLTAAGVTMRPSQFALQDHEPKQWRHYGRGLWRCHQHQPAVETLYQSQLLFAPQILREFCNAHPQNKLPVTFDNW